MTLGLTGVVQHHIIHASDRLTSIVRRSVDPSNHWDRRSNKVLVVVGSDAWTVISYAGLAYIDRVPTDRWMAEVLAGKDLAEGGFIQWRPSEPLHAQRVAELLCGAANEAWGRIPARHRRHSIEILIGGVQAARPRPAQFLWSIERRHDGPFAVEKTDVSTLRSDRDYLLGVVGTTDRNELDLLRGRLRSEGSASADRFRDLLVEAIEGTSRALPDVVGGDPLSVMARPLNGLVEVRYHSARSTTGYSPWVLTPGMILAPAEITGPQEWQVGDLRYLISAPAAPGPFIRYASHRRKPSPR